MDQTRHSGATPPTVKPSHSFRSRLILALALIAIVLVGAYFRTVNLSAWDGRTGHHPDERYMHYTVVGLRVPTDWRNYFVSTCPDPMPAPSNEINEPDPSKWEPSLQSGCSTLNPRNYNWSSGFVYGTLPTTITRLAIETMDRSTTLQSIFPRLDPTDLHQTLVTGRALSALADLITLITTFFLGKLLYGRRVGLLGSALYAGAVMPIQQAHFFTVDQFAVCFGTLALLFTTRLSLRARASDAVLSGLFIGAAVASKINMAVLVGLVFVALGMRVFGLGSRDRGSRDNERGNTERGLGHGFQVQNVIRPALLLLLTGVVCFTAFRVFQPDAFPGPNIWNICEARPDPETGANRLGCLESRFVELLNQSRLTADGTIDLPSSHQWANRTPWLFPLQNMILWGMGAPLGIVAWVGWALAGWQLLKRNWAHLVPWLWMALYFAWQGQQFTLAMRYFLPIYPPLIIFGSWLLVSLLTQALRRRRARVYPQPAPLVRAALRRVRQPVFAIGLLVGVLVATWAWAWGYTRIYTQPYTRVAAAEWIERAAPDGAITTWEVWDDPLPLPNDHYRQIATAPYAEEEPSKYTGNPDAPAPRSDEDAGLIAQLGSADYVVLTSPRVYESVERVPQRFPATTRYYNALFDGSLGFELVADIHNFPSLLGLPINDLAADESFWVYDHPRVLIFRRTDAFTPDRAQQAITNDVAWNDVYRGLRPATITEAPTALQLPARAWERLMQSDTRYLFAAGLPTAAWLVVWLLAIEALGLAGTALLWRMRLPLADRGLSLGRMIGLLLFAVVPGLLGALGLGVGRGLLVAWFGLLALAGGVALWRDRDSLLRFAHHNKTALIVPNALYGVAALIGLALSRLAPLDAFGSVVARWTALVRTPTLPPYDPLFAGGLDPQPYAARLPWAWLDRLLGVPPATGLQLAIATALAIALVGVWAAVYNGTVAYRSTTPAVWHNNRAWLALGSAALLIVPGVIGAALLDLTALGALIQYDLDTLALAALVTTTIAFGLALLRHPRRSYVWGVAGLLTILLLFVRGSGFVPLVVVWLALVALAFAGQRGSWRRAALLTVLPLLGAVLLGGVWTWHLAATAPTAMEITPGALLLALLLPLLLVGGFGGLVGLQLGDRVTLAAIAGLVVIWTIATVLLSLPLALLPVPLFIALLYFAITAWWPLPGGRHWRAGAVLIVGAIAIGLLIIAALRIGGQVPGDAQQLVVIATALLAIATGWIVPLLVRILQRFFRAAQAGTIALASCAILLLGLGAAQIVPLRAVVTEAYAQTPIRSTAEIDAAAWLATNANGVIATAPLQVPSVASTRSGLPTLLAMPEREREIRDVLGPTIGGVIDGRLRTLEAIYGGDEEAARRALRVYHVGYVVLGPDERTAYGETAGSALQSLAAQNALTRVFERDDVTIYRAGVLDGPPPFVAVGTGVTPPSTKTLMLPRPVDELPVVDEFGWNQLATNNQWLAIGLWLLLLELLGLLAFPLAAVAFRRWHDRGWGVSKILGLLIWGYAVWLPVNLGWWRFNWVSLVVGMVVLAGSSALAWRITRNKRTKEQRSTRTGFHALVRSELCFLIAFGVWTLVRAANPDLWHPSFGGEKPFEFGFLNAILRSPVLPPFDPFFADGIINYYYYGLFLVALPIKATGVDSAIGFNLAIATLFAFTATGALALGREMTGRWRWGLIAILFLVGMGPLATVFKVTESRGIAQVWAAAREGMAGFGGRLDWWFWGASRVIPNTINEFPLFGFLFADLHPHLIALPITLLAIACAVELTRQRQFSRILFPISALVIGALAIANSWDAPTYSLLIGGALVGRAWRRRAATLPQRLGRMALAAAQAIGIVSVGLLLYLPFFLHYRAMVGGVGIVRSGDRVAEYALLYGPLLFVAISLLALLAWVVARRAHDPWRAMVRTGTVAVPLLIGVLLLSGWAQVDGATTGDGWPLRLVLLALGAGGLLLGFTARLRDNAWLTLWLITVGMLVALGIQFIFIRDHLADSDWERMNTVFKFGLQLWTLWSIGAATALPIIFRLLRRYEIALGVWLGLLIMLLLPGLVYPLAGIPSRLGTRFNTTDPLTLDGLAFMDNGRYELEGNPVYLQYDADAIDWIKRNIAGTPVFATSDAEFYRAYGMRIAANTGVPTILGRLHQDEQRPRGPVIEREEDVRRLFSTSDPAVAANILAKYHVDYVYVGPIERLLYAEAGAAKWEQMRSDLLELVYENDGVQIYRVNGQQLPQVSTDTPPSVNDDPQLRALEAEYAANPGDVTAAFGLGRRYVELGRGDDAARVLGAAAQQHPNDIPLLHLLGDLLSDIGRDDEAVAAWRQAATTQPTAGNINKLGQGLVKLGRFDEAETELNRALVTDPAAVDPHVWLGELYRLRGQAGDRERAAAAYQQYLDLAPADAAWRGLAEQGLAAVR